MKDKTSLIIAIITGVVAIITSILTNYDKLFGKSTPDKIEISPTVPKVDTTAFCFKLERVVRECQSNFNNILGTKVQSDEKYDYFNSEVKFEDGLAQIGYPRKRSGQIQFNVLIYAGSDMNEATKKYDDILKKITECMNVAMTESNEIEDGYEISNTVFKKGSVEVLISIGTSQDKADKDKIICFRIRNT